MPKLFLCGDVMTGRGIDQILAAPCDAAIAEPWVKDARDYVELAEAAHGPIPRGAGAAYVWGEALAALDAERPDARIVNLETAVTTSPERAAKGINYRMSPANAACLAAARLDPSRATAIRTAGAGRSAVEAAAPAILDAPAGGRVLVFAYGLESSGVPAAWAAGERRPRGRWLPHLTAARAERR